LKKSGAKHESCTVNCAGTAPEFAENIDRDGILTRAGAVRQEVPQ